MPTSADMVWIIPNLSPMIHRLPLSVNGYKSSHRQCIIIHFKGGGKLNQRNLFCHLGQPSLRYECHSWPVHQAPMWCCCRPPQPASPTALEVVGAGQPCKMLNISKCNLALVCLSIPPCSARPVAHVSVMGCYLCVHLQCLQDEPGDKLLSA